MSEPESSDKHAPLSDHLSVEDAFDAACLFVRRYWELNKEIGIDKLIRDIDQSERDGHGASWSNWLQCAEEIALQRRSSPREYGVLGTRFGVPVILRATPPQTTAVDPPAVRLTLQQAFDAARAYVQDYRGLDLIDLLSDSQLGGPGATIDPAAWEAWIRGVGQATAPDE